MRLATYLGVGLLALVAGTPVQAGQCPEPLRSARQLVLVETDGFNTSMATLRRYVRSSRKAEWKADGDPSPSVVGEAGLGWGLTFRKLAREGEPLKQEGDKRAPAGVFKLGAPFGFEASKLLRYMKLEAEKQFCVDDAESPLYSRIVPLAKAGEAKSGERMWEIALYKRGFVIDYLTDRKEKSGSCIFLHVWKAPDNPTAGCVATAEPDVASLQNWIKPKGAVVAILPSQARDRFEGCLP